jgi:hypothetical protein
LEESTYDPTRSATPSRGFFARLSTYAANALRYWEPRRVIYNAILLVVVIGHLFLEWPGSREKVSFDLVLGFFVLAVLANVAYCAVYVVDLFVQFSGLDAPWRRGRVVLMIVGTAFAATIAHFLAKGILGP